MPDDGPVPGRAPRPYRFPWSPPEPADEGAQIIPMTGFRAAEPEPIADEPGAFPADLAAKRKPLNTTRQAKIQGPWTNTGVLPFRTQFDRQVRYLRALGWTRAEIAELAGCHPTGLGCLGSETGRVLAEVWAEIEQGEAEATAQAEAEPIAPAFFDPWAEPMPPEWPGGVLSREAEDTLAALSLADGVDFGAQALAYIAAASGAAPKDARFAPYRHGRWTVPPIVWVMLVADSGQRKTAILENAFTALRHRNSELWADYAEERRRWDALSDDAKKGAIRPPEPHSLIVQDVSPEKLQMILAADPRGTMLLKDELASMFDFGRYSGGMGSAERAFYLEAYEGNPYTVHRIGRDAVHVKGASLAIFGGTQPDRLADFKGLASDGLLQRFLPVRAARATISRPDVAVPNKRRLDDAIARLTMLAGQAYSATIEGGAIIRKTEMLGAEIAVSITEHGKGFQGFASKMNGTHARLALLLHMLDNPDAPVVSDDAIERAGRLLRRFLLPHARGFYDALPDARVPLVRDIAGWVLTKMPERFTAADLKSAIRSCRALGTKELGETLDPLVSGGWLEPEEPFPSNRAWHVNPELRTAFASRAEAERQRRAEVRALMGRLET